MFFSPIFLSFPHSLFHYSFITFLFCFVYLLVYTCVQSFSSSRNIFLSLFPSSIYCHPSILTHFLTIFLLFVFFFLLCVFSLYTSFIFLFISSSIYFHLWYLILRVPLDLRIPSCNSSFELYENAPFPHLAQEACKMN